MDVDEDMFEEALARVLAREARAARMRMKITPTRN